MWFRISNRDFKAGKGEGNRLEMQRLVESGKAPGILAYREGAPVGWCAVAPREEYSRLQNSRILKPVDDLPVWSIVCLFIDKANRGDGVAVGLLQAAVAFVRDRGGEIVEGYAVEPKNEIMPAVFAYHGPASAFLKAGFKEVARRSARRPIMRYYI
ncbi:GNAT family N-acetyltransferase [bacterium]|nr:GNAT family N-acetyltransferase [bacterium]